MAWKWVRDARNLLPGGKKSPPEEEEKDDDEAPVAAAPAPPTSWWSLVRQVFFSSIPLGMLIIGALLTAFAELIGLWAVLGYLLLSSAPVVYWLQRIEQRLDRLAAKRAKPRRAS